MKVILKQDVPNLGAAGDIKEVKNGYARNYLLPRGFVMTATARSQKERTFLEQVQKQKIAKRKKTAEEMSTKLNGAAISVTMKTGEMGKLFGSVTNLHIQKGLADIGYVVDKRNIILDEPIKALGEYDLSVKLHDNIKADIKVRVQDEEGNISWVQAASEEELALGENSAEGEITESTEAMEAAGVEEAAPAEASQEATPEASEPAQEATAADGPEETPQETPAEAVEEAAQPQAEDSTEDTENKE